MKPTVLDRVPAVAARVVGHTLTLAGRQQSDLKVSKHVFQNSLIVNVQIARYNIGTHDLKAEARGQAVLDELNNELEQAASQYQQTLQSLRPELAAHQRSNSQSGAELLSL
jgi:hypothetical protein